MDGAELSRLGVILNEGRERGWQAALARRLNAEYGGAYDRQRVNAWAHDRVPVPRALASWLRLRAATLKDQPDLIPPKAPQPSAVGSICVAAGMSADTVAGALAVQAIEAARALDADGRAEDGDNAEALALALSLLEQAQDLVRSQFA